MTDFHEISIHNSGGMNFHSEIDGHSISIDSSEEHGGTNQGPRPKTLLLLALAGCTGMDVSSLLKKMRAEYSRMEIKVRGDLTEEHPKYYDKIYITYIVEGMPKEHQSKMEKSVDLSLTRYCGVTAMLGKAAEITHTIEFKDK